MQCDDSTAIVVVQLSCGATGYLQSVCVEFPPDQDQDSEQAEEEALLAKNTDPGDYPDQDHKSNSVTEVSLSNSEYLHYKWASIWFIVTGNAFAVFTIAVDGCKQFGGNEFRKHAFFAIIVFDLAILLASRCTEWSIIRTLIADGIDGIDRYLNKLRHMQLRKLVSNPNSFYCCSMVMVWCNLTAVGFAPELKWDTNYAFGGFWEYVGIGK